MHLLRENLALKLMSLALAIGVWLYVRGEDKPVQILSVPLEFQNLPPDLAIAGDFIESVNVRVRAPEVVLKNVTPERFLARVDLSPLAAGDQLVRIRPDAMRIPPGVEVVRVSPEYVPLRLEKKVTRELLVKPRIVGEPAAGYVIGEPRVDPPRSTVEGPESVVRQAREVLTDVVRADERTAPFEVLVDLTPDRTGLRLTGAGSAILRVDIHERYVTKLVTGVKVEPSGATFAVRFAPPAIAVTVEGPPAALADLDEGDLAAIVEMAGLPPQPGEYHLKPRIVFRSAGLEGKVTVRHVSSEEISVRVMPRRGR